MGGFVRSALPIKIFLLVIVAVLILSVAILASTPPVSKDALVHHLAVPKLYLKHGGIYEIPFMTFSYYPMNVDLLYLIPLYFGNDIVPKFMHFVFALLTAWLIFRYLKRRTNTTYALLGVIFFLSTPIVVKLSITAYVDLGLIFFSTASLLLLLKWSENRFRLRFLILSAVFCGLAMGTKYNGLITFFLLTLFAVFICSKYAQGSKQSPFRAVGYGLIFAGIALLLFSPWMIRNFHWTHNPIYPLFEHWFNPQNGKATTSIGPFAFRGLIYHESWWQIALLPLRVFFQGRDGIPQYFDGKLNPFLLLLPVTAFLMARRDTRRLKREKNVLLAFAVLFFAFAFFKTDLRIRYISPIIPPLILLSVLGIKNIVDRIGELKAQGFGRAATIVLFPALIFALAFNAYYIFGQFKYVRPFSYIKGEISHGDYISNYRPEHAAFQYMNDHLPCDARVLFVFLGKRGYYSERDYIFGEGLLEKVFLESKSPQEIYSKLRDKGITHILVYHALFERWVKDNLPKGKEDILKRFFKKYMKPLFFENGFGVSALQDPLS
jgi:4-amino-4-deoxy-L-arabinose transferase-like glycosyltransferase